MKKEIEAFVNAANEQELEAAWNNLSAEEQRVFEQLMEEDSPEDALAFFAQLYDDAPKEQTSETVSISENEIYFKRKPLTEEQKKHGSYVDENGNLHVKNLSAFWIPELTTTEKVGHTTYTVTGSYEGKESFLKKLERIVAKNAQQKFEDEGADEYGRRLQFRDACKRCDCYSGIREDSRSEIQHQHRRNDKRHRFFRQADCCQGRDRHSDCHSCKWLSREEREGQRQHC